VIDNNGTLEDLEARVGEVWRSVEERAAAASS